MSNVSFLLVCIVQQPDLENWQKRKEKKKIWILELSVKSPSLSPPISSGFVPYPLFQWYPQSKEILLNLGTKCWNSAFNAQGSRVITVVVQVGEVKIYVAA